MSSGLVQGRVLAIPDRRVATRPSLSISRKGKSADPGFRVQGLSGSKLSWVTAYLLLVRGKMTALSYEYGEPATQKWPRLTLGPLHGPAESGCQP